MTVTGNHNLTARQPRQDTATGAKFQAAAVTGEFAFLQDCDAMCASEIGKRRENRIPSSIWLMTYSSQQTNIIRYAEASRRCRYLPPAMFLGLGGAVAGMIGGRGGKFAFAGMVTDG